MTSWRPQCQAHALALGSVHPRLFRPFQLAQEFNAEEFGTRLSFKETVADFYVGRLEAMAGMQIFFGRFGRPLANLTAVLHSDAVVLGVGVSNFEAFYTEGMAEEKKCAFTDELETPILKHQLGDSAGF